MRRETSLFLTLGLLSTMVPPLFAQDLQGRPDPVPPSNAIGPQLVAWSEVQKPQPIPKTEAEPGKDRNPSRVKAQAATPAAQQPHSETQSASGDRREKNGR